MNRKAILFSYMFLGLILIMQVTAGDYDLVINNNRTMDLQTNFDPVRNVGI